MEHLIFIRTRSEYVCDQECPWLSMSSSLMTGFCCLFRRDVTILPPSGIPTRVDTCRKVAPHVGD